MAQRKRSILARIRKISLSYPETSERLSHGSPTFFIRGKRAFVMSLDNHHGDGRLALWCAARADIQRMLVKAKPEQYFVPPYVGYLGWVGVRLDRNLSWEEIAGVIEDAYLTVAPKKLIQADLIATRRGRRAGRPDRPRPAAVRRLARGE
jgi:hypothetical protein